MNITKKIRIIWTLMIIYIAAGDVIAQNQQQQNKSDEELENFIKDNLSQRLEKRANNLLKGHINPNHYRISVDLTLNNLSQANSSEKIPYFPYKSRVRATLEKAKVPNYLFTQLVKAIEVSVFISSKYDQKVQNAISNLYKKALIKQSPIEVSVKFESYEIDVPGLASDDSALTKLEQENKDLKKERDGVNSELTNVKTELEKTARDLFLTQEGLEITALLKKNAGVIGGILAWILGIFLLFVVLSGFGKNLGTSIKDVAGSLAGLGDSLSDLGAKGDSDLGAASAVAGGEGSGASGGDSDLGGAALESLQNRLIELRKEILELINEETSNVLLQFLAEALGSNATSYKGVAFLELLGHEKANDFFEKLGSEHQDKITEFLKSGTYPKGKDRAMLEVGELAKTKLFAASYDRMSKNTNKDIKEKVIKLADIDLLEIILGLENDSIPRFLLHLEPVRIGMLLRMVSERDPQKFESVCEILHLLPSSEMGTEAVDQSLMSVIKDYQEKLENNKDRIYIPIFEKIVTSLGEGLEDNAISKISANNDVVGRYLQENIISYGTFFKLQKEQQEDLVDSLTNKNIAAIVIEDESNKEMILGFLSERRQEMVNDELALFENMNSTEKKKVVSESRRALVNKMKKKKQEGTLAFQQDGDAQLDSVA